MFITYPPALCTISFVAGICYELLEEYTSKAPVMHVVHCICFTSTRDQGTVYACPVACILVCGCG